MSIEYQLIRSAKRKTMSIEVLRDQQVVVRVPQAMSEQEVQTLLARKQHWVRQQRLRQAALPQRTPPPDFSERSTHFYLGKPVMLTYRPCKGIVLADDKLHIPESYIGRNDTPEQQYDYAGKRLKEWYRKQAKDYFDQRLQFWLAKISHWRVPTPQPQLRLRYMKSYWGSCNSKHWITLNVHLIKTPPDLIDYVLTHELSHLQEMNHSPAFYQYQQSLLPDWRSRRQKIRHWELKVLP